MCKKVQIDYPNKWNMPNTKSVEENETDKILWDFEIQTDQLIASTKTGLIIVKKVNLPNSVLYCYGKPHDKTKRKWKEEK